MDKMVQLSSKLVMAISGPGERPSAVEKQIGIHHISGRDADLGAAGDSAAFGELMQKNLKLQALRNGKSSPQVFLRPLSTSLTTSSQATRHQHGLL
jgi:hypothetical protein